MRVRCENCSTESELELSPAVKFVCPHCGLEGKYCLIFEFVANPRIIMPLMPMKQTRIENVVIDDPFFKKAKEDFDRLHSRLDSDS